MSGEEKHRLGSAHSHVLGACRTEGNVESHGDMSLQIMPQTRARGQKTASSAVFDPSSCCGEGALQTACRLWQSWSNPAI